MDLGTWSGARRDRSASRASFASPAKFSDSIGAGAARETARKSVAHTARLIRKVCFIVCGFVLNEKGDNGEMEGGGFAHSAELQLKPTLYTQTPSRRGCIIEVASTPHATMVEPSAGDEHPQMKG